MKKILFLFLFSCVSILYTYSQSDVAVLYRVSCGNVIESTDFNLKSPVTVGLNVGFKNDRDIYLLDAGVPSFDMGYFHVGIGKFICNDIYIAGLMGAAYSNSYNKLYPSGGFEVGIIITDFNISTSYTFLNKQSGILSLKLGYTIYKN